MDGGGGGGSWEVTCNRKWISWGRRALSGRGGKSILRIHTVGNNCQHITNAFDI